MSTRKLAVAAGFVLAFGAVAVAESPKLGKPISPKDFAAWDINILPDGSNLPRGSGKAADGAKIFAEQCALCHGDKGQGGRAARLIGRSTRRPTWRCCSTSRAVRACSQTAASSASWS